MEDLDINFSLDKFEKLIIDIGWGSLDDWFNFWNNKRNILSIDQYWSNKVNDDWIWGLALPLLSQAYKFQNNFSDRKIIGISALPGTGKTTLGKWLEAISLKLNFKDITSSHLPKVVLPVPGKAEIPIILRSEKLL